MRHKINNLWVARVFQNRLVLYVTLMVIELQFLVINYLNAHLRHATDGWELKIALIDGHIAPHAFWLIPYFTGFLFSGLVPLWAMFTMPNKLYRQFVLAMITAALFSYAIYVLLPTYVIKPTPDKVPGHDVFDEMLRKTYKADAAASSHNAAPSQHVYYALLNMCFMIRFRPRRRIFVIWTTLGTLITASTLLTRRHNSPDLIAGYLVAIGAYYAGLYLGARVTAWLRDEDGPIVLPTVLTQRVQYYVQRLSGTA